MINFTVVMQRWLGSKRISRVIMILIGLAVTPALVVTVSSVSREAGQVAYVNQELLAAVDFHPLEEVVSHTATRLVMGVLPEDKRDQGKYTKNDASLAEAMEEVQAAMAIAGHPPLEPFWKSMQAAYDRVKGLSPGQASNKQWFTAHEDLFAATLKLRDRVGVETGIILDPDAETYPMMDAMFIRVPDMESYLGKAIGYAIARLSGDDKPEVIDGIVLARGNILATGDIIATDLADAESFSSNGKDVYQAVNESWRKFQTSQAVLVQELQAIRLGKSDRDHAGLMTLALDAIAAVDELHDTGSQRLETLLYARRFSSYLTIGFEAGSLGLFLLISTWLGVLIGRGISRSLGLAVVSAERIAAGDYDNTIEVRGDNETGRMLRAVGIMQTQLKQRAVDELVSREKERAIAADNMRVKVGLDNVSGNVLLADRDGRIIYLNKAIQRLFASAAADFRTVLPGFDPSALLGNILDVKGAAPPDPRIAHQAQVNIGGRSFRVSTSPVVDDHGQWLGTVSEWTDRTQEIAVEEEIAGIVVAASAGDLSKRIASNGKDGFFAKLAEGMNGILTNMSTVVTEINAVVEAGKRQDLTARVATDGKTGVFRQLSEGINALMESMMRVVQQITAASHSVVAGAEEIAKGNSDLSGRTEQQASSLEETASSMEEMTSTVRQNADNAAQANQLARAARQEAEQGGAVVSDAVRAMQDISASSKKIADILGVIDEIAFQTNLLALNAAVEAARAGEQGRGFAVVASEVRMLAGRSAEAAKQIKALIQESVSRVEEGSKLVDRSGSTLAGIVNAVKKVADIVAEISAASQEQSSGIDQVNKAVVQMDGLTQQNAALVEQAAAAAVSLQDQARELLANMANFRVSGGTPMGGSAPRAQQNLEKHPVRDVA